MSVIDFEEVTTANDFQFLYSSDFKVLDIRVMVNKRLLPQQAGNGGLCRVRPPNPSEARGDCAFSHTFSLGHGNTQRRHFEAGTTPSHNSVLSPHLANSARYYASILSIWAHEWSPTSEVQLECNSLLSLCERSTKEDKVKGAWPKGCVPTQL